jgi:hypothetical protein
MGRIQKPLGLYLLIFVDFVAFGILNLLKFLQEVRKAEDPSFVFVFAVVSLGVFTSAAAVWAFLGDDAGRKALLLMISLNFLWLGYEIVMLVIYEGVNDLKKTGILINLGKAVFGFAVNWWYLTRGEIVEYYISQRSK